MLFTYLIQRTDLKKSLYVNKVQILLFYLSMLCWYFPLMTINGSLMAINVPLAVTVILVFLCNLKMYLKESYVYHSNNRSFFFESIIFLVMFL